MWITVGIIAVVVLGGLGLLLYVTLGADSRREDVLARGAPASATILDYARTGMAHGRNDILRFALRVQPASGAAFDAVADRLVTPMEAPQFQVGMTRPVRWLRDGDALRVELE